MGSIFGIWSLKYLEDIHVDKHSSWKKLSLKLRRGVKPTKRNQAITVVSPYPCFSFPQFQLPTINHILEADEPFLTYLRMVNSNVMLHHNACVIHFTSSQHTDRHFII